MGPIHPVWGHVLVSFLCVVALGIPVMEEAEVKRRSLAEAVRSLQT